MARIWLACAALLGLAFVALLALSAHGPQLLAMVFDIRVPDLAGATPTAPGADGKPGPVAAAAAAGGDGPLRLTSFQQALVVHGFHALALGLVALWIDRRGGLFANVAALGFLAGTVLFAGTIYARALGEPVDPSLTPLGGSLLLGAWAVFALSALFGGASATTAAPRPVVRPATVAATRPPATARPAAAPRPAQASSGGWMSGSGPGNPLQLPQAVSRNARRDLQVETRHQETGGSRPPVSGPPKRPAVSR